MSWINANCRLACHLEEQTSQSPLFLPWFVARKILLNNSILHAFKRHKRNHRRDFHMTCGTNGTADHLYFSHDLWRWDDHNLLNGDRPADHLSDCLHDLCKKKQTARPVCADQPLNICAPQDVHVHAIDVRTHVITRTNLVSTHVGRVHGHGGVNWVTSLPNFQQYTTCTE